MDLVVNDVSPDIVHQLEQRRRGCRPTHGAGRRTISTSASTCAIRCCRTCASARRLRYAIDRQAIVEYLRRGLATPAVGPAAADRRGRHAPDVLPDFAHDPARARRCSTQPGYPDPDGDGPAARLRLTLKVSNIEFNRLQAAVIQQDLRARRRRARRAHLRVRDAVRRRAQRQLPALSRCSGPAARWPIPTSCAACFTRRRCRRSASTAATSANAEVDRAARRGGGVGRRGAPAGALRRGAAARRRARRRTSACGTRPTSSWPGAT